ncbi:MAG: dihydroorotase [Bacteroidota bacterium]|nr:dihydroorotase [Bacteroidota bacterium]
MKAHIYLKNCILHHIGHPLHSKQIDMEVQDGIISQMGESIISTATEIIENAHISAGWFDMRVSFCDPGNEHKEDLISGAKAAAAGGFTGVATLPNTVPVADNKSQIEYQKNIQRGGQMLATDIYPMGALSVGLLGKDMAELYDMFQSGAIAFTDGDKAHTNSGLLMRCLQYAKVFGAPIVVMANDEELSKGGKMHEGLVSVNLGLKGIPDIAETAQIQKCLEIVRYTEGKLHFSKVSTPQGLQLIAAAKAEGLNVTADISIQHLIHTDTALESFDTHYKVMPPLRPQNYIDAMIKAINDGTIDCIVSDHKPENIENKAVEFDYAATGCIGTQTLYSAYQTYLADKISLNIFVKAVSNNPRNILNLPAIQIEQGAAANLTVFDPTEKWIYNKQNNLSKSYNTPFDNMEFTGKVLKVIK